MGGARHGTQKRKRRQNQKQMQTTEVKQNTGETKEAMEDTEQNTKEPGYVTIGGEGEKEAQNTSEVEQNNSDSIQVNGEPEREDALDTIISNAVRGYATGPVADLDLAQQKYVAKFEEVKKEKKAEEHHTAFFKRIAFKKIVTAWTTSFVNRSAWKIILLHISEDSKIRLDVCIVAEPHGDLPYPK